ncbi:2Fe-2S ferredoxin [Sphingopyxis lindanitolerans]|uniref:2Fe-2S ferredoxin n=1 Tax=Sphingopyxis lindanitolerans TaxID=2054227 RepID=A0A2S8B5N7_9SPHN|nr:2Fe-2S iron-sulfur cluster-binding protein [Sphingopyxis lindanitolerans]PQM27722.1 2Fe-2S ferredoxin [Sphingopyxis lindanitolerans]
MIKVTYIESNGTAHEVDLDPGQTVMEGAVNAGIGGIWGDCGGACSCATCHVYVDPAWRALTGEKSEMEESMLECATAEVDPEGSRLSCQLAVSDALDGLIIRLPETQ